jgi:hypothetical protein
MSYQLILPTRICSYLCICSQFNSNRQNFRLPTVQHIHHRATLKNCNTGKETNLFVLFSHDLFVAAIIKPRRVSLYSKVKIPGNIVRALSPVSSDSTIEKYYIKMDNHTDKKENKFFPHI